jgi:hypothetical protein
MSKRPAPKNRTQWSAEPTASAAMSTAREFRGDVDAIESMKRDLV